MDQLGLAESVVVVVVVVASSRVTKQTLRRYEASD